MGKTFNIPEFAKAYMCCVVLFFLEHTSHFLAALVISVNFLDAQ